MSDSQGWISIHRKIQDNPLWTSEAFTRGQAWVDLIMLANHKRGFYYLRNHKIEVDRGQVGWSVLKLADRWKWSRTKVNKFLNDLEKEQQVTQQKSKSMSIITIINYNEYQEKEQQQDNSKTTARQQQDTNNNDNNVNNDNKKKEREEKDEKPQQEKKPLLVSDLLSKPDETLTEIENIVLSFWNLFKSNLEEKGITPTSVLNAKLDNWTKPIELMLKKGEATKDDLAEIFRFLKTNDFWKKNIASTSKLREKREMLLAQVRSNENQSQSKYLTPEKMSAVAEITANAIDRKRREREETPNIVNVDDWD